MIYVIAVFIAIFFFITAIAYIIHVVRNYFVVAPPLQPEHNAETAPPLQPEHNDETGIDNATLRTCPTLTFAEARSQDPRAINVSCCSVCLADYEDEGEDEALRLLPECGHLFHAACVDPWLHHRRTCPMCRSLVLNGAMQTPSTGVIPFEIDQI